ncbi:MAG: response regulator [Bacteroidota bacterium]|nr:response regulator [Bacteroidota bacterium]
MENIKKASVLVVEDNHLDMLVIKVLLEKYFNLYIVSNGEDALKAAEEFDFDVVLADINLGDNLMDGVKVMRKLRENERTKDLKIFAVTAYAENIEYYLEAGFDDVLTKPVIKEEIFEILHSSISVNHKFSEPILRNGSNN